MTAISITAFAIKEIFLGSLFFILFGTNFDIKQPVETKLENCFVKGEQFWLLNYINNINKS